MLYFVLYAVLSQMMCLTTSSRELIAFRLNGFLSCQYSILLLFCTYYLPPLDLPQRVQTCTDKNSVINIHKCL